MNNFTIVNAASRNQINFLEELLKGGADVNEMEDGRSALHAACESGAREAVEILIQNKINLDLKDGAKGATALHYCVSNDQYDLAKIILENGGHTDIADNFGNQALWTAVFNVKGNNARLRTVELLLKYGADKHHKNNAGRSPFDLALSLKYEPLIELLSR